MTLSRGTAAVAIPKAWIAATVALALAAGPASATAASTASAVPAAGRPAAGASLASPICGDTSTKGQTPVAVAALKLRFVLPNYWVCVPGSGPLPEAVVVLERVDAQVTSLVPQLRRASVGGFELLPGGRIPCLMTVARTGTGPLPSASFWQQSISGEARATGATLSGLSVKAVTTPGGKVLNATFTEVQAGGATISLDEYLASVSSTLVAFAFQGSPARAVDAQGALVIGTFR
jgi:hypothetical protein